jgi:hypothetical protein
MQRMHSLAWMALLAGGLMLSGCGSSRSEGPAVEATSTVSVEAQPAKDTREPQQVMSDFLELKQKGNHKYADELLSQKAREVIGRTQLPMLETPTGNEVKCKIGDAQVYEDRAARVLTTWTAGEGPMAPHLDIRWLMRNDPEGWRIVGAFGALDPTSTEEGAIDFENEAEVKEFQRKLQAHNTPVQHGSASEDAPPETAAKPSPKAKETTNQ